MKTLLAIVVSGILVSCATPFVRTISVTGEATRTIAPSAARVVIAMSCTRPSPSMARLALDSVLHGVHQALRDQGMALTEMNSTRYSVTELLVNRRTNPPSYDRDSSIGWNARSNATIRMRDLTLVDSLLADIVELHGVSVQDMNFYVEDLEQLYDTLRQEASLSALLRATQLASPLGCEPAHPITIHDGTCIVARDNDDNGFVVRGSRATETQVLVSGITTSDQFTKGLSVSPGLTTISRAVSVQFELDKK